MAGRRLVALGEVVRVATLAIWGALAACATGLEMAGRRGIAGAAPLGRVLVVLRSKTAGRAALVIFWMWFGWHVFVR
jgi:hypothetical protein